MLRTFTRLLLSTTCLLVGGLAGAQEAPAPEPAASGASFSYQLGLATSYSPNYPGSDHMGWGARPVVSLQWGRLRITSSQANLIEGPADGSRAAGASLSFVESARWSSGVALRYDNGRDSDKDPHLLGLPPVRNTLRARLYGRYTFEGTAEDRRSVGATLNSDVLGREGGSTLSLDLSRRLALSPELRWTQGVGITAADATYLRSHHGVSAAAAQASGLPVYVPGAGLVDVHVGTGLTWRLHERWRVGGTLGVSHLLGPVADSPLTFRRTSLSLVLGLVYISRPD